MLGVSLRYRNDIAGRVDPCADVCDSSIPVRDAHPAANVTRRVDRVVSLAPPSVRRPAVIITCERKWRSQLEQADLLSAPFPLVDGRKLNFTTDLSPKRSLGEILTALQRHSAHSLVRLT